MKIAIFSDPHLGYARFESDSYIQAERTILSASENADLILCAGDIFDVKIPKLETLKKAVEIFKKASVPVFVIHGNHERRARDMVNPVHLLEASTNIVILHGKSSIFEKNGERVQVLGIGSVPEEYATDAVKKTMETYQKDEGAFRIIMLHQSIKELIPGASEEISLEYLETLPFDLIINGHIHETIVKLGGRFLIPGSTVITQLKKDEMAEKGYFLYDTKTRSSEFVPVQSRKFFYEKFEFDDVSQSEIEQQILRRVHEIKKDYPDAVIAIKIDGKLKPGLTLDIRIDDQNVYIENRMDQVGLSAKLQEVKTTLEANLSLREIAIRELRAKTKDRITLFDSSELFEKLLNGSEETLEYLEAQNKNTSS